MKKFIIVFILLIACVFCAEHINHKRLVESLLSNGYTTVNNKYYIKDTMECLIDDSMIVCSDNDRDIMGWSHLAVIDNEWIDKLMEE